MAAENIRAGTPTQVMHPWRSTARSIVQAVIGFVSMWAVIVEAIGLDPTLPWVAASLSVTGAVSRVMALPQVEEWLARWVPCLATGAHTEGAGDVSAENA